MGSEGFPESRRAYVQIWACRGVNAVGTNGSCLEQPIEATPLYNDDLHGWDADDGRVVLASGSLTSHSSLSRFFFEPDVLRG
jgi:hypothetical protein